MGSDARHEHGSGVMAQGAYAPGSRMVAPHGAGRGVVAVIPTEIPPKAAVANPAPGPREAHRGRVIGSKNRPKPKPPMRVFDDGPTDQG